ncbi:thioredoxin-like protein [Rhizoctonia solani]|nr:thioredoxin-like protein [Rhizoctonia solani]
MVSIAEITSLPQLNRILEEAAESKKLTASNPAYRSPILDFYSTTCRPCKAIAPSYEAFAEKYKNVVFLKCDIGAAESVADEYGITAVPAFMFLKNEIKVDQVHGAGEMSVKTLEAAIQKHGTEN